MCFFFLKFIFVIGLRSDTILSNWTEKIFKLSKISSDANVQIKKNSEFPKNLTKNYWKYIIKLFIWVNSFISILMSLNTPRVSRCSIKFPTILVKYIPKDTPDILAALNYPTCISWLVQASFHCNNPVCYIHPPR